MSHELGKHLHECVGWCGPLTHRQYLAWERWLQEQWNQPSRTDSYLIQIATEVCRSRAKEPEKVSYKDFILRFLFGKKKDKEKEPSAEEKMIQSQATKARWFGFFGGNIRIRQPDGSLVDAKDAKNG